MKKLIVLVIIVTACTILAWNIANAQSNNQELVEQANEGKTMKVKFYKQDQSQKELIGRAELKNGKLNYSTEDQRLEAMLKNDYHSIIDVEENGVIIDKEIEYKSGSIEHLKQVIEDCKHINCYGELEK